MPSNKNVLLVIADDLGKTLGCYGEKNIKTPNIDSFASKSTIFDNAFASTASCSGSRSVIYTGLHTHENGQYGLTHYTHHFNTFDHIQTALGLLREHGYRTGIISKIHVGPLSASNFFQSSKSDKRPFLLMVRYMDPHRDHTRGGFGNGDEEVSSEDALYSPENVTVPEFLSDIQNPILKYLKKHELDQDTLVIFMSDNSPSFLNSKTTLYNTSIQLPLLIHQPGVSSPESLNPNIVSYINILPTILDWSGYKEKEEQSTSPKLLGRSLLSILGEPTEQDTWRQHVFSSHTFHEITNYYPTRFMRTKRYKYHRNISWKLDFPFSTDLYASLSWEGIRNAPGPVKIGERPLKAYIQRLPEELYDLVEDPTETVNMATDPAPRDLLLELRAELEAWHLQMKGRSLEEINGMFQDGVPLREFGKYPRAEVEVVEETEIVKSG
ncbi:alkaline-phosphatase-like protein [Aspergillus crustosus]